MGLYSKNITMSSLTNDKAEELIALDDKTGTFVSAPPYSSTPKRTPPSPIVSRTSHRGEPRRVDSLENLVTGSTENAAAPVPQVNMWEILFSHTLFLSFL